MARSRINYGSYYNILGYRLESMVSCARSPPAGTAGEGPSPLRPTDLRNLTNCPDLIFGATEEDEMERRRWSADDMAKLQSMAGKYPAKHIAAELGRGLSATMVKAHQLRISLRMKHREGRADNPDPGAAGFDLPTH